MPTDFKTHLLSSTAAVRRSVQQSPPIREVDVPLRDAVQSQSPPRDAVSILRYLKLELSHLLGSLAASNAAPLKTCTALVDTIGLLDDMEHRRKNPLVQFASKAGRSGKREDGFWTRQARAAMAAAALGRKKLAETVPAEAEEKTLRSACNWTWDQVQKNLQPLNISLDKAMPGQWRRDTPEQRERAKTATAAGERIEGWIERELKDDVTFQYRLSELARCDTKEEIDKFCRVQLTGAIERIHGGTMDEPHDPA